MRTVAFDADILCLLLRPSTRPPIDPATGTPVERAAKRLAYLVDELDATHTRIILPAPALAEFLVVADQQGPAYVAAIGKRTVFCVEPFGTVAAIEAAAATRAALDRGNKRSGATGRWQCVKTDRQIVAIAKQHDVTAIYSNDTDMVSIARASGIDVVAVWDLQLPPPDDQALPFETEESHD